MAPTYFLTPGLAARLQADVCAQPWRPRGLALAGVWPCPCCPPCAKRALLSLTAHHWLLDPVSPSPPSLSVTSLQEALPPLSSLPEAAASFCLVWCVCLPGSASREAQRECWLRAVPMGACTHGSSAGGYTPAGGRRPSGGWARGPLPREPLPVRWPDGCVMRLQGG